MFDLEDSITIESHRIPWLIWIQILVFFLLLFLFYSFGLFTCSDLSLNNQYSSASTSTSASPSVSYSNKAIFKNQKHRNNSTTVVNLLQHHNQVGGSQSIKGEIAATSTSRAIVTEENISQGLSTNSIVDFHPCNYFRLAKLAFLKCFGLDPTTENCSSPDRKKER